jgi:tRNA nucleotidyltransferase/poly(A) polymerase
VTARLTLDALGAGARELLQALDEALGPGRPAWLVGGAVRDALSGAIVRDLDLAVPSGAIALARELAGRLDAAFVVLDEKRGAARLTGAGWLCVARAPGRRRRFPGTGSRGGPAGA